MSGCARSVLGDIASSALGAVNYHEHLFQVSPLLVGDELDDERRSGLEAGRLRASGFDAMIDATPLGLGRRPEAIARISRETGLTVIASTGRHREQHYRADHPLRELTEAALAELFAREITHGMDDTAIRAGLIKTGISYWAISHFERTTLGAAATAHLATGAPIMVHLEHGSAAFAVIELLDSLGVRANSVVLAHIDRNPDPVLHADLAAAGAYLGYDGFARSRIFPDSILIDCAVAAIERGAGERIVIGGDVARRNRYVEYGGMPGLQYVGDRVLPRLRAAVGTASTHRLTTENASELVCRF